MSSDTHTHHLETQATRACELYSIDCVADARDPGRVRSWLSAPCACVAQAAQPLHLPPRCAGAAACPTTLPLRVGLLRTVGFVRSPLAVLEQFRPSPVNFVYNTSVIHRILNEIERLRSWALCVIGQCIARPHSPRAAKALDLHFWWPFLIISFIKCVPSCSDLQEIEPQD